MTFDPAMTWNVVLNTLEQHPMGAALRLPKHWALHPEDCGATRSIGLPQGQSADYRWRLPDGRGLHARDFGTYYEAHIDCVDPSEDAVKHLRVDAPVAYVTGLSAAGLLLGTLLGGSKGAAVAGLTIGAALGLLTLPGNPGDS